MKKLVTLGIILLMSTCMIGNVYASFSCNVKMEASKTQVSKDDEFTVNVDVSKIQSEIGIITFGGTLEYDKDSLELIKMEGQNGWESPSKGSSYNSSTGTIAISRNGPEKNDETIFQITFKVKETNKKNVVITLKDVTVADGSKPVKISNINQNITVIATIPNNVAESKTDYKETDTNTNENKNVNKNESINKNTNVNGNKNSELTSNENTKSNTNTNVIKNTVDNKTVKSGILPKAGGNNNNILVIFIGFIMIVAGIFFLKIRKMNKEI